MTVYTEHDLDNMYEDYLDECYGDVLVTGYKFPTSQALRKLDPVAYRCGFVDWLDCELSDEIIFEWADGSYHDEKQEEEGQ